jgi:glycosyltransferase involved in cell wall biosynthesis
MSLGRPDNLNVLELGMHERGAGGGADRYFWDLFDNLKLFPELTLRAFHFQHQGKGSGGTENEECLGSTRLAASRRLLNLRRAVLPKLRLAGNGPHLVASHFALYAAALLPGLARVPHVVHFHGPWAIEAAVERGNPLNVFMKRALERLIYPTADAFITLSQSFKNLLTLEYKVDPRRVHVIPGGVDILRFFPCDRRKARARLGWPQDVPILFCLRRLARRMGLEILLEAFREAAAHRPDAILMIGGTGPLRAELEARIGGYGLTHRVRLLGFVPEQELALAYQAADLSIVPSQSLEGFGLTTLESLACGTPVLVTPVGGLPETVGSLEPKLVLADAPTGTLAKSLDQFLSGGLALPSPEDCRRYVELNFSWSKIAKQVSNVYWEVATG